MVMGLSNFLLRLSYKYLFRSFRDTYFFINDFKISEGNVLDIGGGPGNIYDIIETDRIYYITLDIDFELLSYASNKVDKVLASSNEKIFRDGVFDHIIIYEALHHFTDPIMTLYRSYQYLSKCIHLVDFDVGKLGGLLFKWFHYMVLMKTIFYSLNDIIGFIHWLNPSLKLKIKWSNILNGMYYLRICK